MTENVSEQNHSTPAEATTSSAKAEVWLGQHLAYLRGLKNPSDQQKLLLLLADKTTRTAEDERQLAVLVRAEKAAERATKARAEATKIINAQQVAARKARDHEMYLAAGLLGLVGLVNRETGKPTWDRGELLGALQELAALSHDDPRRAMWKRNGDALLAKKS